MQPLPLLRKFYFKDILLLTNPSNLWLCMNHSVCLFPELEKQLFLQKHVTIWRTTGQRGCWSFLAASAHEAHEVAQGLPQPLPRACPASFLPVGRDWGTASCTHKQGYLQLAVRAWLSPLVPWFLLSVSRNKNRPYLMEFLWRPNEIMHITWWHIKRAQYMLALIINLESSSWQEAFITHSNQVGCSHYTLLQHLDLPCNLCYTFNHLFNVYLLS